MNAVPVDQMRQVDADNLAYLRDLIDAEADHERIQRSAQMGPCGTEVYAMVLDRDLKGARAAVVAQIGAYYSGRLPGES